MKTNYFNSVRGAIAPIAPPYGSATDSAKNVFISSASIQQRFVSATQLLLNKDSFINPASIYAKFFS